MTYDELIEVLNEIHWFANVGEYRSEGNYLAIPSLSAWNQAEFGADVNDSIRFIAANMEWLPTMPDQVDPLNGGNLKEALSLFPDGRKHVTRAHKVAIKLLRDFDKNKFKSGSHDFSLAAKGGALYCVRMVASESLLNKPGVWTKLFDLYKSGYWPCGVMKDGRIVVY